MPSTRGPTCSGVKPSGGRCSSIDAIHRIREGWLCKNHRAQASWLFDTDDRALEREKRHSAGNQKCCGLTKAMALCEKPIGRERRALKLNLCIYHEDQCPPSHWKLSRGKLETGEHDDDEVHLEIRERMLKFVEFRNSTINDRPKDEFQTEEPLSGETKKPRTQASPEPDESLKPQPDTSGHHYYNTLMLLAFLHVFFPPLCYLYLLYLFVSGAERVRAWVRTQWRHASQAEAHEHERTETRNAEDQPEEEPAVKENAEEDEETEEEEPEEPEEDTSSEDEEEEQSTSGDDESQQASTGQNDTGTQSAPGPAEWRKALFEYGIALDRFLDSRWSEENPASFDKIPWPVFRTKTQLGHTFLPTGISEREVTVFIKAMSVYDNSLLKKCRTIWQPDRFSGRRVFLSIGDAEERTIVQGKVTMVSQCINAVWAQYRTEFNQRRS
ncbi:hypothetical protein PQX77_000491 [Marasmius sp. AFHP31]|nr:hypothetical protein PQX77_000491 [Marasmius sp. AFHP31]